MAAEPKKRVRWAESDHILGEDSERASKIPRCAHDDDKAAFGLMKSSTEEDATTCGIATEGLQIGRRSLGTSLPPSCNEPCMIKHAALVLLELYRDMV